MKPARAGRDLSEREVRQLMAGEKIHRHFLGWPPLWETRARTRSPRAELDTRPPAPAVLAGVLIREGAG